VIELTFPSLLSVPPDVVLRFFGFAFEGEAPHFFRILVFSSPSRLRDEATILLLVTLFLPITFASTRRASQRLFFRENLFVDSFTFLQSQLCFQVEIFFRGKHLRQIAGLSALGISPDGEMCPADQGLRPG